MKPIRLLCIAIFGMVVGNAECAQQVGIPPAPPQQPPVVHPLLDLPIGLNGTPGLHMVVGVARPVLITKSVNNQNVSCLHVIVPGTEAAANGINAMNFSGNIYFPRNGAQPTTPEAVEYSCANIDNRENSPITEWYMQMFGVIQIPAGGYIRAGWSAPVAGGVVNAQRIISFDANCSGHPHNNCSVVNYGNTHVVNDPNIPGAQISRRALFEREFRKIASTSVGRVLLYRILIEIRRQREGKGVLETNMSIDPVIGKGLSINEFYTLNVDVCELRNICRSISIIWHLQNSFSFQPSGNIYISNATAKKQTLIYTFDNRLAVISLEDSRLDEDLFHEMCHWYHYLRDPYRFTNDTQTATAKICKINDANRIGSLFYGSKYDDQYLKSASVAWCSMNNTIGGLAVNFEEIRTILGSSPNCVNYLEGDDISENLYILANKYKNGSLYPSIRFGHMDYHCVELLGPVFTALMNSLCILSMYEHTKFLPIICVNEMLPSMCNMKAQKCGAMYPDIVKRLAKKVIWLYN